MRYQWRSVGYGFGYSDQPRNGNWQIASPYPSAPYTSSAPNPCRLQTTYLGAPVNVPFYERYNPESELSQWIGPNGGGSTPVPGLYQGLPPNSVPPSGQLLSDNAAAVMDLHAVGDTSAGCNVAETSAIANQYSSWNAFALTGPVVPATHQAIYSGLYPKLGDAAAKSDRAPD
jgi:hypothetical protein